MNIVITGAARGIGKAIAEKFAAENNTLFLCAKTAETLTETHAHIEKTFSGAIVHSMVADLSKYNETKSFCEWCLSFAVPDIVINNAGSFAPGSVINQTEGVLENMINTNLYSAYYVTAGLAPQMITKGSGHIFNVCSIAGLNAYEGGGAYSISKFAMNGFSKNLRHELMSKNIKVTTVFPGAVFTDSWSGFDNSTNRIMEATDIADVILACTKLSASAVPEEITLRPQLGDL